MDVKKLTAYSIINTGEGKRVTCNYSVINADTGMIKSENNRINFIVLDKETQDVVTALEKLIDTKLQVSESV